MNQQEPAGNEDLAAPDELTSLKARADMVGLKYHPSISLEKLREKVSAAVSGEPVGFDAQDSVAAQESEGAARQRLRREANELIRIRLTCMNPDKKNWDGEVFTVGNSTVGTFSKFVPFAAEDGWHVPRIIYNQLVDRKCQVFSVSKDSKGRDVQKGKLIREFAIELLPNLTTDELEELARRQALAHSID